MSTALDLTEAQLKTLRHMLGINKAGNGRRPEPYRDYYCASSGDQKMTELVAIGAVRQYQPAAPSRYEWFQTTEAGRLAAIQSWRPKFAQTKAKRIYARFLSCLDCNQDLSFREFLTSPIYAEIRREA